MGRMNIYVNQERLKLLKRAQALWPLKSTAALLWDALAEAVGRAEQPRTVQGLADEVRRARERS